MPIRMRQTAHFSKRTRNAASALSSSSPTTHYSPECSAQVSISSSRPSGDDRSIDTQPPELPLNNIQHLPPNLTRLNRGLYALSLPPELPPPRDIHQPKPARINLLDNSTLINQLGDPRSISDLAVANLDWDPYAPRGIDCLGVD
ncbi:hypothetical protein P152DRAFT_453505 [Eremomyces bilateralis CBS 781.70]|uniref:Uncharacterized protein n=1 Tax=Eremomyces bilateralis CBS 781.70 TaxID=1392243 RepID=A0A6G1GFR2_9PEZI|nr:uncharacterized protein P152DRAFT_453505 [Eremomyces bilateralis CBS 781.70]KAF1816893.1 hypothetical protein P152DRAFT_453505 [Eremomyces bilateralis CBS 781.70]